MSQCKDRWKINRKVYLSGSALLYLGEMVPGCGKSNSLNQALTFKQSAAVSSYVYKD